jgi:uncharacterized protein
MKQHPDHEAAIVVRRPRWTFPDDLDDIFADPDLEEACFRVAFSLTLPHLEPYLIRTYRRLLPSLDDERLAAEVEAFCGQEAQHHRNHALVNRIIRSKLGEHTGARLLAIEQELGADYRRFGEERSDRFNAAYAEGFEAMTCAMGLTMLAQGAPTDRFGPWQQLWAWHLAEEIEHRTVAFDVYHHLGGSYPHRVVASVAAQRHFFGYLDRLHRVLLEHHGVRRGPLPYVPRALRIGWRRYLRTFSPRYDPARIETPPAVEALLAMVDVAPAA